MKRLFYRLFKRYRRLELRCVTWVIGAQLIRESVGKPECEQWVIAKEEDTNRRMGLVYLERRERIIYDRYNHQDRTAG